MLTQPARRNPGKSPTVIGASIPAPIGGWNAISPLAAMDIKDAVILDNWIPRAGYVEVRKGSRAWNIGASSPVESLLIWRGAASGVDQMYAVTGGDIYNSTVMDTGFGAPVKSGLANDRIEYINFANSGGSFILCVNGADTPFHYDGTSWTNLTISGVSGPITLDPTTLCVIVGYKSRVFLIEKGTLRVWFLDVNAIQGTAQLLDLGPVFKEGGQLRAMSTWSLNGTEGQDTYLVFMTDQGEIAIYQGTDPADYTNWAHVGNFDVGIPLGRRCLMKYGSDLYALTTNGVLPLSQALARDRAADKNVAITAKIQNAFSTSAQLYLSNFGWEGITYQKGTLAIYNVPIAELTTSYQYVQNIQTGAWCRFLGLDAFCWAITDDNIFFGAADGIYQWDVGVTDAGVDLVADLKSAFNYFGDRGNLKRFSMLRPTLNATANVIPAIELLVDYQEREPTAIPTTIVDRSTALSIRDNWTSVTGLGYCGSVRMQVRLTTDPTQLSTLVDGAGSDIVTGDGMGGAGDTIVTDSSDPLDATIQAIAMSLLYQKGGHL